jgi:ABC-2 type transport system permease protein
MRQAWIILCEDLRRWLRAPGGYALLAFFYLIEAALLFIVLVQASSEPQAEPPFKNFWQVQWLANLVLVPLLTMWSISSERRAGLLESLLSTPTTPMEVVAGKFGALYILYLLAWLAVPVYMLLIWMLGGLPPSDLAYLFEPSSLLGGGIFCAASGLALVALGVFSSSLTRNGWLSGGLTACVMLLFMTTPAMLAGNFPAGWEGLNYMGGLSDFADGRIEGASLLDSGLMMVLLLVAAALALERRADA